MKISLLNTSDDPSEKKKIARFRKRAGSFGGRPCRSLRRKLLACGPSALPKSWRKSWMVARILATPEWVDMAPIKERYMEAAYLTALTGRRYVVDHIIPLQHERVCGLHVAWNMQVLTYAANSAKSNYFCPEQQDLFDDVPQLELNLQEM